MIYSPVAGLKGDFGPLPAGDWTFTCPSRDLNFEIHFTVQEKFAYHVDADAPGSVHDGRSWSHRHAHPSGCLGGGRQRR